eukprot:403336353
MKNLKANCLAVLTISSTISLIQAAKELDFVANIGSHGHSYFPHAARFNHILASNETFDDYSFKNITPLGIRQQYLIGQELRRRFITNLSSGTGIPGYNATFLNESYKISEIFTRTSGNSQSYLSANSLMIGLYPPETCNQKLTEWQQKNVRPPLFEGVTPEEIADIGEFATKGGYTPFDIFNQYQTEDQMNEYDGLGCQRYRQLRDRAFNSTEFMAIKNNLTQQYSSILSNLTGQVLSNYEDSLEFCQFTFDSWIDGYDFNAFEYPGQLQTICKKFLESQYYYKLYANKELQTLKISELTQLIATRLIGDLEPHVLNSDSKMLADYNYMISHHQYMMKFNNFYKIATFRMFNLLGDPVNVKAFLNLISDEFKWEHSPPSTMILLELYEDQVANSSGKLEIKGYVKVKYNDKLVTLKGRCAGKTECDSLDFIYTLRDSGVNMSSEMRVISFSMIFLLSQTTDVKELKEELLLVVEISRHGARSPGKLFDLAQYPEQNFKYQSQLTSRGKNQHYQLGQYIREKYVDKLKFLSKDYDESETYVQTTYLNRTYLSALYQLMGMYPENLPHHLDFQKYENLATEDYLSSLQKNEIQCIDKCKQHFLIHQVNATHDFLLHVDDENCPRFSLIKDILKGSNQYQQIGQFFMEQYGSRLEQILNWNNVTNQKLLINLCGYIQWAQLENLQLKFNYTQQDLSYCLAAGDSKLYFKGYGHNETWKLGAFEFLRQIQEFIHILMHDDLFETKVYWSKYFKQHFHQNLPKNKQPKFPKFIHYAAHAETLAVFQEALGIQSGVRVEPGSALFIEFLRIKDNNPYDNSVNQYFIRLIRKEENKPEQIIRSDYMQDDKINMKEFYQYLNTRVESHSTDPDYIEKQCENLHFSYTVADLIKPEKVISNLVSYYQLDKNELIKDNNKCNNNTHSNKDSCTG